MEEAYKEYLTHVRAQLEISLKALYDSTSADIIFVSTLDSLNSTATTFACLMTAKL